MKRKPLMPGDRVRCRVRCRITPRCPGHRVTAAHFYAGGNQTVNTYPDPCGYCGGATVQAGHFVRLPKRASR